MSADGKEAAGLLLKARYDDFVAFLSNRTNFLTPGFKTQVEQKWTKILEAYVYYQNGTIP